MAEVNHSPLPHKFDNTRVMGCISMLDYETLDQVGDEVLLKVIPKGGGPAFFEALTVHYTEGGYPQIRPNPGMDLHDPNSNQRSLEVMTRVHQRRIGSVESREGQKQRELEQLKRDKEALRLQQEWQEIVNELKNLKYNLIAELKPLLRDQTINSLIKDKKAREISDKLEFIELKLKYGQTFDNT